MLVLSKENSDMDLWLVAIVGLCVLGLLTVH
jgi:hypothetical protein